jgi:hypothetical protein
MPRIAFDADTPLDNEADRACSVLTRLAGEPLIGHTPAMPQGWLLVEDNGPWGTESAARTPRLPASLRAAAIARKIRLQLVRRHRPRRDAVPRTLMVAWTDRDRSWLEVADCDDPAGLATTIDLDRVAAGQRPHVGSVATKPVVLVCTQGGVDPCCAKFGRPVAATLAEAYGPMVWEATHVGMCRFAANIVCLPAGVIYGHSNPALSVRQVEELLAGRLVPDGLRGHAGIARAVQVAELAVRRRVDQWELDAVTRLGHTIAEDRHMVSLGVGDHVFDVTLTELPGSPRTVGCGDDQFQSYDELRVVGVTESPS